MNSRDRMKVAEARRLLHEHGHVCSVTDDELSIWIEADTPFDVGFGLDQVLKSRLLVVHELVEIDEVKRMGLKLTKNVIVDNMGKVDDAHLAATKVELEIAIDLCDRSHIKDRLKDLKAWIAEPSVTPANRTEYQRLLEQVTRELDRMSAPD